MDAQAIVAVSAAVTGLTQVFKWQGLPDHLGPVAVLILSLLGVAAWGYSQEALPGRVELFGYFAAWITVALTSAGVFGFTRAGAAAVTRAKEPPMDGAGSSPTH